VKPAWRGPDGDSGGRHLKVQVTPEYPQSAQRMNLSGTVQVRAIVRADGTVKDVKVIGGHPLLAECAYPGSAEVEIRTLQQGISGIGEVQLWAIING
jgi:hypothetical protein